MRPAAGTLRRPRVAGARLWAVVRESMAAGAGVVRQPAAAGARVRSALTPDPRLRRRMLVAALIAALIGGLYLFWLRDSSLVAVEQVSVTGLTSRDSDRLRAALTSTAETMTTLHVEPDRLERAAAAFPVVAAIEVARDFPHGLKIHVIEHRPAAVIDVDGRSIPIAGDGSVLAGMPVEGDLPAIELSGGLPQRRLPPGAARDSARVAGGAPAVIARRLESVGREGGPRGVVVQVEDGPEIVFGGAERVAAKWAAAVRVLADEEAAGAAYVDVRIPERPVAGGVAVETVTPVAPLGDTTVDPSLATPDPTAAAPVDPTLATPTDATADGTTAAPETGLPVPAPVTETQAAPAVPDAGGGAATYPQP
ncbi:MAG TPA: FtsQ-type POTRA domain-containing protein [Thermoleophilaceae bacterium]|nr:FtsQ-type POTRA domain-containing protein [Thermoleophilaceae bacterium]